MWKFGWTYKIWYLDVMDVMDVERCCSIRAKSSEAAMDEFQSFDKHKMLQIIACDEIAD